MAESDLIRDPKALRALAHPFRWKLIAVLSGEGPCTATRCAELTGESVASCSYHLNMLAKYGFVEEVPDQGRQKPWRLARRDQSWSSLGLDQEGALAAEAASEAFLEQEFASIRERFRRRELEPEEWRRVVGIDATLNFLTAEEARAALEEVREVLRRHADRVDPDARPDGARPVRFLLATTVMPKRDN
ncbi:ArsR/SmtB family transcription factor [Saccharothrix syringae]|uniref:ArsR/SmtB family transcription factor n=1 Tax=Saccharothrix syringae TaxID=103733 RepID=UPI0014776573|nr:winged helix-turn-helix domain-containing protein [Saccharothrix syringae]